MLAVFQKYIQKHKLIAPGQKVLAGVSGGPDSIALLHLLIMGGYQLGIAHANFGLRGKESDADELFVRSLASEHQINIYCKKFDTEKFLEEEKNSVQMAARELRYNWFSELALTYGYDVIALGHHRDDQVETFFINLFRGSGLKGLKAMEPRNGLLIRPLLFADRKQIMAYIDQKKLSYRTDRSNQSNKYLRNEIRNQLLPQIFSIDNKAEHAIKKSIQLLGQNHGLYEELVTKAINELIQQQSETFVIPKKQLFAYVNWATLLWEILAPWNFDGKVMPFLIKAMDEEPGKRFYSTSHRLVINRENIEIIAIKDIQTDLPTLISINTNYQGDKLSLEFTTLKNDSSFFLDPSPMLAFIDMDLVQFPLTLRTWEQGDRFQPLGVNGSKLLSDFFIDANFSLKQKEDARVLCNANGEIMWLIGQRVDHRYRIKSKTKKILKIHLKWL